MYTLLGVWLIKNKDIDQRTADKEADRKLKAIELQQKTEAEANKGLTKLEETQRKITAESENVDRKLAVDVVKARV